MGGRERIGGPVSRTSGLAAMHAASSMAGAGVATTIGRGACGAPGASVSVASSRECDDAQRPGSGLLFEWQAMGASPGLQQQACAAAFGPAPGTCAHAQVAGATSSTSCASAAKAATSSFGSGRPESIGESIGRFRPGHQGRAPRGRDFRSGRVPFAA
jgi:hypothetical protein